MSQCFPHSLNQYGINLTPIVYCDVPQVVCQSLDILLFRSSKALYRDVISLDEDALLDRFAEGDVKFVQFHNDID